MNCLKVQKTKLGRGTDLLEFYQDCKIQFKINQMTARKSRLNWTEEEDQLIREIYERGNEISWKKISKELRRKCPDWRRTAKQCRERYMNFLKFGVESPVFTEWTQDEEKKMFQHFDTFGSRWVKIASLLPGKSQNCIKNKFYGTLRKTLRKMNRIQKQHGPKTRKIMKYESLLKFLEFSSAQNQEQQVKKLKDLNLDLRGVRLMLLKLITSQTQNDQQYLSFLEKIHEFNIVTRFIPRGSIKTKKNCNITQMEKCQREDSSTKSANGNLAFEKQNKQLKNQRIQQEKPHPNNQLLIDMFNFEKQWQNIGDGMDFMEERIDPFDSLY